MASDGSKLPVIDVTSPEFAPLYDEAEMARRVAIFARADRWRTLVPRKLQRLMLSVVARRSRLARAVLHSQGGVVTGMTLYAAKLGPRMLGSAYPTAIDRRLAAAPPAW